MGRVREGVHVPGVGVMLYVTMLGKTQYARLDVVLEQRVCVKSLRDVMTAT